jgi:hypothetical protein
VTVSIERPVSDDSSGASDHGVQSCMDELVRIPAGHAIERDANDEPLEHSSLLCCHWSVNFSPEGTKSLWCDPLAYLFIGQSKDVVECAADGVKLFACDDSKQLPLSDVLEV